MTCSPRQVSATSVVNCGINGVACVACPPGNICTNGVCAPPMMGAKKVGDSCTADADCQRDLGASAICKLMTTSGNAPYTGGYCTVRCGTAPGQCPTGSSCVQLPPRYGEADTFCWDECSSMDRCRSPGYACYQLSNGNACWINPLPPEDAGPPADKVGNVCTGDIDCKPPDEGICLDRQFNMNWTGGYCTKPGCQTNPECSADGGAICLSFSDNETSCVQKCPDSSAGQSTCRAGYLCNGYISRLADGGQMMSVDGFCAPPEAPIPGRTGDTCANDGDCQVPDGSIADCIPPVLLDGGPSGWTGGYCSRFGCQVDGECSPDGGAGCFQLSGGASACFQKCPMAGAGQSTCRAAYVCQGYRLGDGGPSVDGICQRACTAVGAPACPMGLTCNMTTGNCN